MARRIALAFSFNVAVRDLRDLNDISGELGGTENDGMKPALSLEPLGGGRSLEFRLRLETPPGKEGDAAGRSLLAALVADSYFTLRLRAPAVVSTSGMVDDEHRTTTWKVSLGELIKVPSPRELTAEIRAAPEGRFLWILVAAVGVAVLIGGGLLVRLGRRERSGSGST